MLLKKITYTPYNLQFAKAFVTAKKTYFQRTGFVLKITDELGNTTLGEAAPLENFGADSLIDTEKSLKKIGDKLSGFELPDEFNEISNFSLQLKLSPTVHFAFDQCLINLFLKRNCHSLAEIFAKRKMEIPVNFVLGFHPVNETLSVIEKTIDDGFKTFKLKVGRDDFNNDLEVVEAVRNKFGETINIRLDANGKWELDNAIKNIFKFKQFNIQYIEQPAASITGILSLSENSPIPIAPDECIKTFDDAGIFLQNKNTNFIVLKPALLGSIFQIFRFIEEVNKKNKNVIISSAIETAVGRSAVNFIASFTNHQYSHGLATSGFFISDLTTDSYPVENGTIDISKYPPEFN